MTSLAELSKKGHCLVRKKNVGLVHNKNSERLERKVKAHLRADVAN